MATTAMSADHPGRRDPERQAQRWMIALLLALLTHALLLAGFVVFDPFAPRLFDRRAARNAEPIELVFEAPAEDPQGTEDEGPTTFTELPEANADLAPETPDFLSNVDSRAADRVLEGEENGLPRMEGVTEDPQVAMSPPPPGERVEEQPVAEPVDDPAEAATEDPLAGAAAEAPERGGDAFGERPEPVEVTPGEAGTQLERNAQSEITQPIVEERPGEPVEWETRYELDAGRSDIYQDEMMNFRGNVALFGDVSLNTIAWDFAPWIQEFRRRFYRNLFPPYAFLALGMIDGQQLVDLEIGPDGHLIRMEVVEERGHESLREATLAAFRASAPYRALPNDFPEPTLKIRIKMSYILPRR